MSEEKSKFKIGDRVRFKVLNWDYPLGSSQLKNYCTVDQILEGTIHNIHEDNLTISDDNYYLFQTYPGRLNSVEVLENITTRIENIKKRPATTKVLADPQGKTPGFKDDAKKPDLTDVPLDAMWQMGQAFTYGQKKYSKNNYRTGMHVSRQLAAAVRHIYQHLDGQNNDAESGCTHLGHAMASLAMAIYNLENNPEMDDRFEKDIEKYEVKK